LKDNRPTTINAFDLQFRILCVCTFIGFCTSVKRSVLGDYLSRKLVCKSCRRSFYRFLVICLTLSISKDRFNDQLLSALKKMSLVSELAWFSIDDLSRPTSPTASKSVESSTPDYSRNIPCHTVNGSKGGGEACNGVLPFLEELQEPICFSRMMVRVPSFALTHASCPFSLTFRT